MGPPDLGSDASSISMEFLLAGKPVVGSRNVGCFLRLPKIFVPPSF